MAALALSILSGIIKNGLKMEKVYFYLPQVNGDFSNIFFSITSLAYAVPATAVVAVHYLLAAHFAHSDSW